MENTFNKESKLLNAFLIALGLVLFFSFPLLLVFGLKLMGLPVSVGFGSWFGGILISAFLVIVFRFSKFKTK
jgi:uncharacterized membrane protein (DUF485 family)